MNKDKLPIFCEKRDCELTDCIKHDCNVTKLYGWNKMFLRDNLYISSKSNKCKNYNKGSDV